MDGHTLYASPIISTQLLALLFATYQDLNTRNQTEEISFYQHHYTTWSYEVAVANGTLRYGSILSVVNRYLKLTPGQDDHSITWTRVGCLFNGGKPVADIALVPLIEDHDSVAAKSGGTNVPAIPTTPVKVMTVSPIGITNTTEIISPNALDICKDSSMSTLPKRQASSLERKVILKVFNTGLRVTARMHREPDGVLARVLPVFFVVAIILALSKFALGMIAELLIGSYAANAAGKFYGIDSGSYHLGQLSVRFVMKSTARDRVGNLVGFDATFWESLAETMLVPLKIADTTKEVYAVGGTLSGPDTVNGTDKMVKIGEWKMAVNQKPAVVHDEL